MQEDSIGKGTNKYANYGNKKLIKEVAILMPIVDISFPVFGTELMVDHGYPLFSAVSQKIPEFHDDEINIHPIFGVVNRRNRTLRLTGRSRLVFRMDHIKLPIVLPLAGSTLDIGQYRIRLGIPEAQLLKPSAVCKSRLVTIKGYVDAEPFLKAVHQQLERLGISGSPKLLVRKDPKPDGTSYVKRTIKIRDKDVVGFAVQVEGLSDESSIRLQEVGIGGRRKMGCGVFVPVKKERI